MKLFFFFFGSPHHTMNLCSNISVEVGEIHLFDID